MRRRFRRLAPRAALALAGGSVLAFLVVPVLTVIPMSFSSSMTFELIPAVPGLTQYRRAKNASSLDGLPGITDRPEPVDVD